jgi:hypothetical protein
MARGQVYVSIDGHEVLPSATHLAVFVELRLFAPILV